MAGTPFKMKGSPFQRNFGIGSPLKQERVVSKREGAFSPPDDSGDWKRVSGTRIWEKKKTEGLHTKIGDQKVTAQKTTKKNSEFDKAFSSARKAGKKEFTYQGKKYHTKLKT